MFLRCERIVDESENYQCSIYNDDNGETWKEGIFAVENGNPEFNPDDKDLYEGYDGDILLANSRRLVLLTPSEKTIK